MKAYELINKFNELKMEVEKALSKKDTEKALILVENFEYDTNLEEYEEQTELANKYLKFVKLPEVGMSNAELLYGYSLEKKISTDLASVEIAKNKIVNDIESYIKAIKEKAKEVTKS